VFSDINFAKLDSEIAIEAVTKKSSDSLACMQKDAH